MKEIKTTILTVFKKYYLFISLIALATIQLMLILHNDYYGINTNLNSVKLIFTFIYGAIASLAVSNLILEVKNKIKGANLLYLAVPLLMALVYFVIFNNVDTATPILKYFVLTLVTMILTVIIPFLNSKEDSHYYTYRIISSLFLTGITYALVVGGSLAALKTISLLFEVSVKSYIYVEVAIFILGILMPTLFLMFIPTSVYEQKDYPKFFTKINNYVIYPLLTLYTFILYMYLIRLLFMGELPSNMLGNLTIYYMVISLIVLYFSYNVQIKMKWELLFNKYYPYALIVPLMMMLTAFIVRINYYGVTQLRYYALLCFIFASVSIIILIKTSKVKNMGLTLAILLLASIIDPISAPSVSKYSQNKLLETILKDNNMLVDGKIIKNDSLTNEEKTKINNILYYFYTHHQLDDIDVLPDNFTLKDTENVFGIK